MDYNNHNTTLRTNRHLNFEERFYFKIGDINLFVKNVD